MWQAQASPGKSRECLTFLDDPHEDQGMPGEGQCLNSNIPMWVTFLAILMDICPCWILKTRYDRSLPFSQ